MIMTRRLLRAVVVTTLIQPPCWMRPLPPALDTALLNLKRTWAEGISNAANLEEREASARGGDIAWTSISYGNQFWETHDGDFNARSSTSLSVSDAGFYTFDSTARMIGDLQAWFMKPPDNFSRVMKGDEANPRKLI